MIIVSYGAGTNSTALLIGMKERNIKPDLILFADTGGEKPHTYKYIETMQKWLKSVDFPEITIVKKTTKEGEILTLEQDCLNHKTLPSIAFGFKTCSQKYKIQPMDKFVNNWQPAKEIWERKEKITKVIGIDADETHRVKNNFEDKKYNLWYPLMEWDWGREECIEAIKNENLPLPGKSACFFCPNSKKTEIFELKRKYPELALRAIEMEDNTENLISVKGLGRTWKWRNLLKQVDIFDDFPERNDDQPCECYDG